MHVILLDNDQDGLNDLYFHQYVLLVMDSHNAITIYIKVRACSWTKYNLLRELTVISTINIEHNFVMYINMIYYLLLLLYSETITKTNVYIHK